MKPWLRRTLLILFWVGVGALIAGIVGFVLGSMSGAVLPFVVGLVAVALVLPLMLISGVAGSAGTPLRELTKLKPEEPPAPDLPRELGRIESLREVGLTVRNFHHLYEFTVTVFPQVGDARREVFSQLITMGQLPNFYTGRYVVLVALPGEPVKLRLDPAPSEEWKAVLHSAPERFDSVVAPAGTGDSPRADARAAGAPPGGSAPAPGRTGLNLVIVAVCVIVGFVGSMILVLGGPQRAQIVVSEIPQRVTGQVHGLWDSAMLEHDLHALREQLAGRDLEYLYVFDSYFSIDAYSETYAGGEDSYVFRDGSLELSWTSTMVGTTGKFRVEDVDAGMIRAAVAQVYAADPDAQIRAVRVRVAQGGLRISVDVEGVYEDTTREFDARTGEEILES